MFDYRRQPPRSGRARRFFRRTRCPRRNDRREPLRLILLRRAMVTSRVETPGIVLAPRGSLNPWCQSDQWTSRSTLVLGYPAHTRAGAPSRVMKRNHSVFPRDRQQGTAPAIAGGYQCPVPGASAHQAGSSAGAGGDGSEGGGLLFGTGGSLPRSTRPSSTSSSRRLGSMTKRMSSAGSFFT